MHAELYLSDVEWALAANKRFLLCLVIKSLERSGVSLG